jgi:hypothetical protein
MSALQYACASLSVHYFRALKAHAALRACLSVRLQGAPMPAHANKKPPTRLELKQAYEAELRVSRPARLSACQL